MTDESAPAPFSANQSAALWRYLWFDQGVMAFLVNVAINAVIAWWTFRGMDVAPVEGEPGIAADVLGTCLILPLIANFIVSKLTQQRVGAGTLPRRPHPKETMLRFLHHPGWRGLILAVSTWLLVGLPAKWLLPKIIPNGLPSTQWVQVKAIFAGCLGAIICPLSALLSLADHLPSDEIPADPSGSRP